MFCPKCSQEQLSEDIKFCSRCGFLLTGIAEVIAHHGVVPGAAQEQKKLLAKIRKKGVKQGFFMLILTVLLFPILMIVGKELNIRPSIFILSMFVLLTAGVVRMIYALMFEADEPPAERDFQAGRSEVSASRSTALPPPSINPAADFVPPVKGTWRDSQELIFSSVTDVTTRQLEKK